MTKTNVVDFTKKPFKGIYAEIAKELGVSQQAISQAVRIHKNPRILTLVTKKVKERKNAIKQFDNAVRAAV
jgi:uncharacterized protein YqeY